MKLKTTGLTELPNWNNVTTVDCSNCPITELPNWNNNTVVYCSGLNQFRNNTKSIDTCTICLLPEIEVFKCRYCVLIVCSQCLTKWNKSMCMYCKQNF